MTLEQATRQMLEAIEAQDLKGLASALDARGVAIAAGSKPTLEILQAGERAASALAAWKQQIAFESARLDLLRAGIARTLSPRPNPRVNCRG